MRKGVFVLVLIAILLSIFTVFQEASQGKIPIVGHTVFGTVGLYIFGDAIDITIHSPLNATYNFGIGSNYTLTLNVSALPDNDYTWRFTLEDLRHGTTINSSVLFTPNISFNAVRWSNRLTVYANGTSGIEGTRSVVFYVSVPNSAPLLGNISSQLYACESDSFSQFFNATDPDEDNLQVSTSPTTPFFVFPSSFNGQINITSELFSGTLSKSQIGNYSRTLSVTDGQYSDSKDVNITVIEINNIPTVENIGVQTLYLQGEGSQFNETISVSDIEGGNQDSGNFSFNVSFNGGQTLFNISSVGKMSFSPNASQIGVHNVSYCVADRAISNIHPNIALCSNTGLNNTVCRNFSITVTDENRAPTITDYNPDSLTLSASGTQTLNFDITSYDPDGTIPDVYWYVDGALYSYVQNDYTTQISYAYPCETSGSKNVRAVITDGLENDSVQWNITLSSTACPVSVPGTGGGGGGGGASCLQKWACNDWSICQNTQRSLELGIIEGDDYREVSEECAANGFDEGKCGFQTRYCYDDAFCNSTFKAPATVQFCDFTVNPSCYDGIKNCHDGTCELLVDCGGPCDQCGTCSDKKQNQGELGVDCGGPCPFACPAEQPFLGISIWRTIFLWIFWIILLVLLILLISRVVKLIQVHNEIKKERRVQSALSSR